MAVATAGWLSSVQAMELASPGLGAPANNASNGAALSGDGGVAAFYSDASNLVAGDINRVRDVFIRDLNADTTELVSVSSTGEQANGPSHSNGLSPAISGNGQIVAFYSDATNLVDHDANGQSDVFVRDRKAGTTELISVAPDGVTPGNGSSTAPSISSDGRYVAFQSLATNLGPTVNNTGSAIFVRDRVAHTTELACGMHGNGPSSFPAISADGNFVAFASAASNLVGGDTNGHIDIFLCDRRSGFIQLVSVAYNGALGNGDSVLPAINGNGTVVGFKSTADNLVVGDTNGIIDVFVRDRTAVTTERISVNVNGGNSDDVSFRPSLSNDGRFVVFGSFATNLVPSDGNRVPDVFVRDRTIHATALVDKNALGAEANSGVPDVVAAISDDAKSIAFVSSATNLVVQRTNGIGDIFVTLNPCAAPDGCYPSGTPTLGPPTSTPTPTPTFIPCTADTQCPPGKEFCRGGTCKKPRPCDDSNPAIDRHLCYSRETCVTEPCIDGTPGPCAFCECGGDCNLDGYVFVNEINKAVKILNGLVPVNQCVAADINDDGSVMANEVMIAVQNLGQGCEQEGRPLIFAHARGGLVTLSVGDLAGAPGDLVDVPIDLSGGRGEVAAAQVDLLFDPTVVAIDDPASACFKDPRLTEHVFSAILTASPSAPAGLKRLRLFIGDLTPPVVGFDDGHVATCTFQIKGHAGAPAALAADRVNISDAQGDIFGSQVVTDGAPILLPTPTPGGALVHDVCPGDCDGDGNVLVTEITMGVRIMAGEIPLSACPAADADGDGEVFVTDITRAVIALGSGCPE